MPEIRDISEPLLVDAEGGRIYATADIDGTLGSIALSTTDGSLLAVYSFSGKLALDRGHERLLVDQGYPGVAILDSITGEHLGQIEIPVSGESAAHPQVDSDSGIAYVFREGTVYVLDIETAAVVVSHTLSVPLEVCGEVQGNAPIERSFYDSSSATLYISLRTWDCTGFLRDTVFSYRYDGIKLYEVGACDTASDYQAVPFSGSLYGTAKDTRLELVSFWACRDYDKWFDDYAGGSVFELWGVTVDQKRKLLYEDIWIHESDGVNKQIRISSAETRQLLDTIQINSSSVQYARLAGHDSHTDHLYFLENGNLVIVPTTSILPVEP